MTDLDNLRTAVRTAPPRDPTPRLVYADCLEESGEILVAAHQRIIAEPDNNTWRYALADVLERLPEMRMKCTHDGKCPINCDGTFFLDPTPKLRAELVRVQCELARFGPRPPACKRAGKKIGRDCPGCLPEILWQDDTATLRDRESTLLTALRDTLPKCIVCDGSGLLDKHADGDADCPWCENGTGRVGRYTRGIVEEVRVPRLADVWEEVSCPHIIRGPGEWCKCNRTGLIWQPTQWARDLIRDHPSVLRVWCDDRVPAREEGGWEWYDLPDFLCTPATKKTFNSPEATRLALAVAVAESLREARP